MISVTQAYAHLAALAPTPASQRVAVNDALGRALSQDCIAGLTQPPLDGSAMDGYAVRSADVGTAGATLSVIGEAPAGAPFDGSIASGQAVRIFTGGAIPDGADTVIIQENVTRERDQITVTTPQDQPRHIRKAGIDFHKGDTLLRAGDTLDTAALGVLAAANHSHVRVKRKLKIAVLSCGNELRAPGSNLSPGQIVNSNPVALAAMITTLGGEPMILPTAKDSLRSLSRTISLAKDADIILTVGGASVGDYDYMRQAFEEAGLEMVFSKIAIKPGKPTWAGRLPSADGPDQAVLGLPGNPASALICATLFLPVIMGYDVLQPITAVLLDAVGSNGPRETYLRAQAAIDASGQITVCAMPHQDSGLMRPFLRANCLLKRAPQAAAQEAGERAEIILIGQGLAATDPHTAVL